VQNVQGDLPCWSVKNSWDSSKAWSWKSSKNGSGATLPINTNTCNQSIKCKRHVLYECIERKRKWFCEFWHKNHWFWSCGWKDMNFWSFGAIFVDSSKARDPFGIIFQIPGPNCKIMDYGLISKKLRGLNEKCLKERNFGFIFELIIPWARSTSRGPLGLRSTMDWPPSPTGGAHWRSTDGRPGPRKLTVTAREERGAHPGSV
jgi:hypothetical protein